MHADPDLLVLLALGEPDGTEIEREHVAACEDCGAELAELRRVVDLTRSATLALSEPGPGVWAGIRGALDAGPVEESPAVRSYARLRPVLEPWSQASGDAELATDGSGRRLLQVTLHADLPASGLRQAWLVHRHDPSRRQTLGVLDGQYGLWTVAHAIDLEQYAILEISQQSVGDTAPTGETIVRGELQPVAA